MKRRVLYKYMAAVLIGMSLLSGCSDKKAESKATYRQNGIAYMEQGDYANAIKQFDTALSQKIGTVTKDDLDICYYKAAAQNASGDIESAINTYHAIIDFKEDAYEAYYLRGCLYCKQGNMEAAKADFLNAVKYSSKEYELYLNIYSNLMAVGDVEAGEEYLRQALDVKRNENTDLEYRGQIYYLLGEYDNAKKELGEALKKGSTKANLYLAKVFDAIKDEESAEAYYEAYIASVPTDAPALNELGEMMLEKGRYGEAVRYFELAMDCQEITNKRVLMYNLILAYEYNGNFYKAWEMVKEYVQLFPQDEEVQREYIFLKNRQMNGGVEETENLEGTESSETVTNTEGTGNTGEGSNSEGTGNTGEGSNSEGTGSTGEGSNSEETGSTGEGSNSQGTGSTGEGSNSEGTGSTVEGSNSEGTGSTGEGSNSEGTGSTGEGSNSEGTGSTGEGSN